MFYLIRKVASLSRLATICLSFLIVALLSLSPTRQDMGVLLVADRGVDALLTVTGGRSRFFGRLIPHVVLNVDRLALRCLQLEGYAVF